MQPPLVAFGGFKTKLPQIPVGFLKSHQGLQCKSPISNCLCWQWSFCTKEHASMSCRHHHIAPWLLILDGRAGCLGKPCHSPGLGLLPPSSPKDTMCQRIALSVTRFAAAEATQGSSSQCTCVLHNRLSLPVTFLLYPNLQITDGND